MPINFQVVLNELGGSRLQFVKRSPRRAGHVMANGPRVIKRVLLEALVSRFFIVLAFSSPLLAAGRRKRWATPNNILFPLYFQLNYAILLPTNLRHSRRRATVGFLVDTAIVIHIHERYTREDEHSH